MSTVEIVKLYESYIELWSAVPKNILKIYEKAVEKFQDEYRCAWAMGYVDGYKAGLHEALS